MSAPARSSAETCEIRWRKQIHGRWVFYAQMSGPRGIDQSVEFREWLEVGGWTSGFRGYPKYPKLCTRYGDGSDKNDAILTRFISQLVHQGWEFSHTVSDQAPLVAVLTRPARH